MEIESNVPLNNTILVDDNQIGMDNYDFQNDAYQEVEDNFADQIQENGVNFDIRENRKDFDMPQDEYFNAIS